MLTTLEWLKLAAAVFAAVLGATYQLANQDAEKKKRHSPFQLVVSFVSAVFLTGLLQMLLFFKGGVYWLWVAVFGFVFSLGAEHVVRLLMGYQKGAKTLVGYYRRWKKIDDLISSGKLDLDDDDSTNDKPTNQPIP